MVTPSEIKHTMEGRLMEKTYSEHETQIQIFEWAKFMEHKYPELKLLNASLNGVRLTIGQAKKAKLTGMKKGYPDIFLPVAKSGFHGLFIELKVGPNKATKEQKWWIEQLNKQGYFARVCKGFDETTWTILEYLKGGLCEDSNS